MITMRATVESLIEGRGYEPYQIDGIPEGFSFIRRVDRQLGGMYDVGHIVAFDTRSETKWQVPIVIPMTNPTKEVIDGEIEYAAVKLLDLYTKKHNGQK